MKSSVDPTEPAFGPGPEHHACPCLLCARERKFYRIAAKLPPRDEAWLLGFYDYVVTDLEREVQKASVYKRRPNHHISHPA